MLLLPIELLKKLEAALKSSYPDFLSFKGFLNTLDEGRIGFTYDEVTSPSATFETSRWDYLTALNRRAAIFYFVGQYKEEPFGENPLVQEFRNFYEAFFESAPGEHTLPQIRQEIFDCSLVKDDKLIFIDREELKSYLFNLVHGKESRYLLINGKPGTGRSYTGYYLSKIAEVTGHFKMVKIDFNEIFRRVKGQIQMVHIARELIKIPEFNLSFGMDFLEHFKYDEFYPEFLKFLGKAPEQYLFFFDQFNLPYTEEVKGFINEFVNDLSNDLIEKHFIALVGFEEAREWDFELVETAGIVQTDSFSKEHLLVFIRKLYDALSLKFNLTFTADQLIKMLQEGQTFLRDELYDPGSESNVTSVGREVHNWFFKKLKKEIEGQ